MAENDLKLASIYSFLDIFKNLDILKKANLTFKSIENYIAFQNPSRNVAIELESRLFLLLWKFSHYKSFFTRILKFCSFYNIPLENEQVNRGFKTWDASLKLDVILSILEHQLMKRTFRCYISEEEDRTRSQPIGSLNGFSVYAFKDASGDVRVVGWRVHDHLEEMSILCRNRRMLENLMASLKEAGGQGDTCKEEDEEEKNNNVLLGPLETLLQECKPDEAIVETASLLAGSPSEEVLQASMSPPLTETMAGALQVSTLHQETVQGGLRHHHSSPPLLPPPHHLPTTAPPIASTDYHCSSPSNESDSDPSFTLGPDDSESDEDIPACDEEEAEVVVAVKPTKRKKPTKSRSKAKVPKKGRRTAGRKAAVVSKEVQGVMKYFKQQKANTPNRGAIRCWSVGRESVCKSATPIYKHQGLNEGGVMFNTGTKVRHTWGHVYGDSHSDQTLPVKSVYLDDCYRNEVVECEGYDEGECDYNDGEEDYNGGEWEEDYDGYEEEGCEEEYVEENYDWCDNGYAGVEGYEGDEYESVKYCAETDGGGDVYEDNKVLSYGDVIDCDELDGNCDDCFVVELVE